MQASRRRIVRWVLGGVLAVVLAMALFVATLAAQMSGGWDEVLDFSHPQPSDPEVVSARESGARQVDDEIERVVHTVVVPALAAGRVAQPAPVGPQPDLGPGIGSACEVGSHNWKRDDGYDLLCVEIRRAVVAAGAPTLATDFAVLHRALLADGWTPTDEQSGLLAALERAQAVGPEPAGGLRIASASYRSADAGFRLELGFGDPQPYTGQPAPPLAEHEYAMMVSVSRESFLA